MSLELDRSDSVETGSYVHAVEEIAGFIHNRVGHSPSLGIIAFGQAKELLNELCGIKEDEIILDQPYLDGDFLRGKSPFASVRMISECLVLCVEGGVYGNETMNQLALPVRVMGVLGVQALVMMTDACSLGADYKSGDICLFSDHINLLGNSPLVGPNIDQWGPRFPDMTEPYDLALRQQCLTSGKEQGIEIRESVFCGNFAGREQEAW